MDRTLADFYKTQENLGVLGGDYTGEDLQKQAAAEFLVKLAAEEGVDLGSLPDEQVGQLLAEVESGMSGQIKTAQAAEETEMQEKLGEADFLGRAMAHAYVDELAEIEKQAAKAKVVQEAGSRIGKLMGHLGETYRGAGGGLAGAGAVAKRGGEHQVQALKSMGQSIKSLVTGEAKKGAKGKGVHAAGQSVRGAALKSLGESAMQASPTLAAAGGAGYGIHRGIKALKGGEKEKASSDQGFENAAFERAQQLLIESGYVDQEKLAEIEQNQVETRALQMLEEAGYPVQWNQ